MFKDEAMTDVYISIRTGLMKAVSKIVPPKDIEDIVQETYVRVCQVENRSKIKYPRSFLFKTARNLALDHVKRAESRLTTGVVSEEDFDAVLNDNFSDSPYSQLCSNRDFSDFCEAVRHLPVQCRRVFVLKKVYGYSQKEISRSLGIAESTVEKNISTGIKRCTLFMMNLKQSKKDVSPLAGGADSSMPNVVSMRGGKGGDS